MKPIKIVASIYKDRIVSWCCCVCNQQGPIKAMIELNDGRTVHRWPCRDRLVH